jgi:hypothetical protein
MSNKTFWKRWKEMGDKNPAYIPKYKEEWTELYEHITKDMSSEQIESLSKRALNSND